MHYRDQAWSKVDFPPDPTDLDPDSVPNLNAVWGSSPDNVYIVGREKTLIRYDGREWTVITDQLPNDIIGDPEDIGENGEELYLVDIWGSSADDIYVVGDSLSLFHFNGTIWRNLGKDLQDRQRPDSMAPLYWPHLYGVWGSGPDNVFVVGENGYIWRHDGDKWHLEESRTRRRFYGIWGNGPDDVFAYGDNGALVHFNGSVWEPIYADTATLTDAWPLSENVLLFAGNKGGIYRLTRAPK